MDKSTVDEIIATERRRYRRLSLWSLLGLLVGLAGLVVTGLSEHAYPLPPLLIRNPWIGAMTGCSIGLAIIVVAFFRNRAPWGAEAPDVLERQIETYQNRYRWWLIFLATIVLVGAANVTILPLYLPSDFGVAGRASFQTIRLFVIEVVCILPFVVFSWRRPNLSIPEGVNVNDELTRELRLRAVRIGYIALMLSVVGSYLWLLNNPGDARLILPWILAGGVTVPAVAFALLHWRAGREE